MQPHRSTERLRRLVIDTEAGSAVEFALLLPVMILLLVGTFDIARAIDVKNKTSLMSRAVTVFVSQSKTITPGQLDNIVKAARSVLHPYDTGANVLTVSVQSIRPAESGGGHIIDWSYTPTSAANRPLNASEFTPPDSSVVRTNVQYTYNLRFTGFLFERLGFRTIQLNSPSYMTPRWGAPVEASGFPAG